MKEFMLYVRNDGSELPADVELTFLKACEAYIGELTEQGKLVSAQPLGDEGTIVVKNASGWSQKPCRAGGEINAGYYHIRAESLDDAIAIARRNPEFAFRPSASIEVRGIKSDEETTGYVYPSGATT